MDVKHHFAVRYPDLTIFPRQLDEKISTHGLHLKTTKEVQVGEAVGIQFRFPQREEPLKATGVVAWVSAKPDGQGKRSFVVRNLALDEASQELLELVRSTPVVEEAELGQEPGNDDAPTQPPAPQQPPPQPTQPAPQQQPPQAPPQQPQQPTQTPAPPPSPQIPPREPAARPRVESPTAQGGGGKSRKGLWIGLGLLLLVGGGLTWFFAFGGDRIVAMLALDAPPPLTVPPPAATVMGVEPPLPAPKAPPPPKKRVLPPAVAQSFDYFQRSGENEFIITFNRPVREVVTSRIQSPLMHVFYVERARNGLDKGQYFLPFEYVRTVQLEEQGGDLRVLFISQRSDYLPDPVWEIRGRELRVRFIAQD